MLNPIRLDADRDDLGPKLPQGFGGDLIGRAIGAIDHDAQALQRKIAQKGPLGEFYVAGAVALDPHGAAKIGGLR